MPVRPDLTVDGFPRVYALGDFANIPYGDEDALPQLGSVAQQAGDWAAGNIIAGMAGEEPPAVPLRDKGIMAMIGRKAAVAEIGPTAMRCTAGSRSPRGSASMPNCSPTREPS